MHQGLLTKTNLATFKNQPPKIKLVQKQFSAERTSQLANFNDNDCDIFLICNFNFLAFAGTDGVSLCAL